MNAENTKKTAKNIDFIREIVIKYLGNGKNASRVATRFPPEPNGFLHIGHCKAICINFEIAKEFGGTCNLRFDDTNPCKEDLRYVEAIIEDINWLGFKPDKILYASDYFEKMFEYALMLIDKGKAYVCDLNTDQIREFRGTLNSFGKNSPFRSRSIEENRKIFFEMREGKFPDGSKTLRAKIDMAHPNMLMRDPVMYRILHSTHHRTGDKWCIYPTYDWAHGLEDSIERITHSICTLEFEIHRPLYDWFLDQLELEDHPQQIEFARLNLAYTIMSKRKLLELVEKKYVSGWDDPRMPTIAGMRRRGYPQKALRTFCEMIGVTKFNSITDFALLEFCIREELNKSATRMMAVLNPIKVLIENFSDQTEELDAVNNPEDPSAGKRKIKFTREIYIEQDDFRELPPPKFHRLAPDTEVRLRYAYIIKCKKIIKDNNGKITEIICEYDPATKGGNTPDGRKIKGTIHWVSAKFAVKAEIRLYDRLFNKENPDECPEGKDFTANLNTDSKKVVEGFVEPALSSSVPGTVFQFERLGYFCVDTDSTPDKPVFNRTVTLKDTWSKIEKSKKLCAN